MYVCMYVRMYVRTYVHIMYHVCMYVCMYDVCTTTLFDNIFNKNVVQCTSLSSPTNGNVSCNSTDVSRYEDQCSFTCDPGYKLTESSSRQCLSDGTWSSEPVTCIILKCNDPELEIANSQSVSICNVTYGSSCSLSCSSGFSASSNGEHVCDDVNDEGTSVKWRSVGGSFTCVNNGENILYS